MCYGAAGRNGKRALHMYQEQFSNRNQPHHTMFAHLYQCLREDGSLHLRCIGVRPRQTRTPAFEEEVLERVGNDPSTSTRAIVHAMSSNKSSVLRVLQEQTSMHTTSRKYKNWGPMTLQLVFELSNGFCNGVSLILPFLHMSWLLLHKRRLLQQQKQPHMGRRESTRSVHQSSPGEIPM